MAIDENYKTSTLCGVGPCVLVKRTETQVLVRDSKLADDSLVLEFDHAEWLAFLSGVKKGEFDV